jgi:hypothetical protein
MRAAWMPHRPQATSHPMDIYTYIYPYSCIGISVLAQYSTLKRAVEEHRLFTAYTEVVFDIVRYHAQAKRKVELSKETGSNGSGTQFTDPHLRHDTPLADDNNSCHSSSQLVTSGIPVRLVLYV